MIAFRRYILSVSCMICLFGAAQAEDHLSAIRDEAGLFRADAVQRAEQRIDGIHRAFDRNLFVYTLPPIAPRRRWHFRFQTARQVNRILDEQAHKIAEQTGADGIYLVIGTKPRDVHVVVRPSDDPLFGRRDAEALRRMVASRLGDRGADQTLIALVDRVRAVLRDRARHGPSTTTVSEFTLAAILGLIVALWLVLRIVRFKRRAGPSSVEDAAEETPALFAAMLGSPCGQWIYDELYPRSPRTPAMPKEEPTAKTEDGDISPEETPEHAPMVP